MSEIATRSKRVNSCGRCGAAASYQWYLNDTPLSGATSVTYQAQESGSYKVEVLDNNGCHGVSIPVSVIVIGITETMQDEFPELMLYPNPFTSDLTLDIDSKKVTCSASFVITNALGEKVYAAQETRLGRHSTKLLALSHLPSGIYFLQVMIDQHKVIKKIVKE